VGRSKSNIATNRTSKDLPEDIQALERHTAVAADRFAESMPRLVLHKPTRTVLTIALCLMGVVFFLCHGGWVQDLWHPAAKTEDGRRHLRLFTLANLIARIVLIHPLVEHLAHHALHLFQVHGHIQHHHEVARGLQEPMTFEAWPYIVAVLAYPMPWTRPASLGLLQYAWFHQLSHDLPFLALPGTSNLHLIHHADSHLNYGISGATFPFQHWPDVLFGTYHD
jgi:hypothetical protein